MPQHSTKFVILLALLFALPCTYVLTGARALETNASLLPIDQSGVVARLKSKPVVLLTALCVRDRSKSDARAVDSQDVDGGLGDHTPEQAQEIFEFAVVEPPLDPIEKGHSTLNLHFVHSGTEDAFKTDVDLWRLGAPGNDDWKTGDQLQASGETKNGEVIFEALPEGMYRLHVHTLSPDAIDPPAFEVLGDETLHVVVLESPEKVAVHLRVFDEEGCLIESGACQSGGFSVSFTSADTPEWVNERSMTGGRLSNTSCGMSFGHGHGGGGIEEAKWVESFAVKGDFPVGVYARTTRHRSYSSARRYLFDGNAFVDVHIDTEHLPLRSLVALSVSNDWLRKRLRVNDEEIPFEVDEKLISVCNATLLPEHVDPWEFAKKLSISVELHQGDTVHAGRATLHDAHIKVLPSKRNE